MELPKRKPTRLKEYDYSANGAYFITLCTNNRKNLLSTINVGVGVLDDPQNILTNFGKIAEKHINEMNKSMFCHIHLI